MEYGAFPEPHELATAKVFVRLGFDVLFLAPSRSHKGKTPDVKIGGCPLGDKIADGQE